MLKKIEGPFSVITIAGGYRKSQNFLLNRLILKVKEGFEVAGEVNNNTKGIWVWSQLLEY
jgi:hypothetical protein